MVSVYCLIWVTTLVKKIGKKNLQISLSSWHLSHGHYLDHVLSIGWELEIESCDLDNVLCKCLVGTSRSSTTFIGGRWLNGELHWSNFELSWNIFAYNRKNGIFLPALLQHNAYKNDPARPFQVRENMKLLKTVALVAIEAQNGMK